MATNTVSNATATATANANAELVSYDVIAMNGKEAGTTLKLYTKALIEHTQKIQKLRDAGNMTVLAIANEIRKTDDDKSYQDAGFKSVTDYAYEVFDYKRPTVALYLKAARAFLEEKDGKIVFVRNLPTMTMGQLIELLPLVKNDTDVSDVVTAIQSGTINARMSTKALRKAVRDVNAIDGEVTSEKDAKEEKTELEKAAKLGEFNPDKLPKNTTPQEYATAMLDAAVESLTNFHKALGAIDHNATIDSKFNSVIKSLTEIRAEITA